MKFAAVGDAIIGRRIPEEFAGYAELSPYIKGADAAFFNLETTLNEPGECYAAQSSGGTYLRTTPRVLPDLCRFGFNLTTFNNNHAFDFATGGFLATLKALEGSSLVHAGCGKNLGEAAAAQYLDTPAGRVALIAINTSFTEDMLAGEQSPRVPGRPGINGIRIKKHVKVTAREYEMVREIAEKTGINVAKEISIKEGYSQPTTEGELMLDTMRFVLSDRCEYVMEADRTDVERVKRAIYEAQLQADYIMVSVHSHQLSGDAKENPSHFLETLAHELIDAGAHAIIGHGPHLLRPIEVYKNCPIFYSLGDFILQLYNIELAPADFFAKQSLPANATVHELLAKRSKDFTRGLMTDERMFLSVMPLWETDGTRMTSLKLLPILSPMTGKKSEVGLPRVCAPEKVIDYLGKMSAPYGTRLKACADGLIDVEWD